VRGIVQRIAGTEKLNRETLVDRLSAQLRQLIVSESIKPGEAFPSERDDDTFRGPGVESQRAADLLKDRFPSQSGPAGRKGTEASEPLRTEGGR